LRHYSLAVGEASRAGAGLLRTCSGRDVPRTSDQT